MYKKRYVSFTPDAKNWLVSLYHWTGVDAELPTSLLIIVTFLRYHLKKYVPLRTWGMSIPHLLFYCWVFGIHYKIISKNKFLDSLKTNIGLYFPKISVEIPLKLFFCLESIPYLQPPVLRPSLPQSKCLNYAHAFFKYSEGVSSSLHYNQ